MAEKERVLVAVPKDTDDLVTKLADQMDETKGKVVKIAIDAFAKKNLKVADGEEK